MSDVGAVEERPAPIAPAAEENAYSAAYVVSVTSIIPLHIR